MVFLWVLTSVNILIHSPHSPTPRGQRPFLESIPAFELLPEVRTTYHQCPLFRQIIAAALSRSSSQPLGCPSSVGCGNPFPSPGPSAILPHLEPIESQLRRSKLNLGLKIGLVEPWVHPGLAHLYRPCYSNYCHTGPLVPQKICPGICPREDPLSLWF